jgi:signal transduction histidine kinase
MEAHITEVVELIGTLSQQLEARADTAREHANVLRRRVRILAICCFGMATALAAGLAVAITRRLVGRVSALRTGARSLGEGNLSARVLLGGQDEFSELAQAFNDMASSLARNQEQLLRSQKLASVGQVAAGVAHEINNPLGVILGYVKLMRRKPGTADDDGLRVIEDEAVQCQRVVQGLLDLARTPTLIPEPVDLGALTRECVERLLASDRGGGVGIDTSNVRSGVTALGDEMRLKQVVTNLLLNAVEASSPGQKVVVEVRREGAQALLTVLDTGRGMSDETRSHVFEPFFTTKAGGTGLGLAVAHAVVDAHHGEIRLERADGGGTRAVVLLPPTAGTA